MLSTYKHLRIKEGNTPYDYSCKLLDNLGKLVVQQEYVSVISNLYVIYCARPDVANAF